MALSFVDRIGVDKKDFPSTPSPPPSMPPPVPKATTTLPSLPSKPSSFIDRIPAKKEGLGTKRQPRVRFAPAPIPTSVSVEEEVSVPELSSFELARGGLEGLFEPVDRPLFTLSEEDKERSKRVTEGVKWVLEKPRQLSAAALPSASSLMLGWETLSALVPQLEKLVPLAAEKQEDPEFQKEYPLLSGIPNPLTEELLRSSGEWAQKVLDKEEFPRLLTGAPPSLEEYTAIAVGGLTFPYKFLQGVGANIQEIFGIDTETEKASTMIVDMASPYLQAIQYGATHGKMGSMKPLLERITYEPGQFVFDVLGMVGAFRGYKSFTKAERMQGALTNIMERYSKDKISKQDAFKEIQDLGITKDQLSRAQQLIVDADIAPEVLGKSLLNPYEYGPVKPQTELLRAASEAVSKKGGRRTRKVPPKSLLELGAETVRGKKRPSKKPRFLWSAEQLRKGREKFVGVPESMRGEVTGSLLERAQKTVTLQEGLPEKPLTALAQEAVTTHGVESPKFSKSMQDMALDNTPAEVVNNTADIAKIDRVTSPRGMEEQLVVGEGLSPDAVNKLLKFSEGNPFDFSKEALAEGLFDVAYQQADPRSGLDGAAVGSLGNPTNPGVGYVRNFDDRALDIAPILEPELKASVKQGIAKDAKGVPQNVDFLRHMQGVGGGIDGPLVQLVYRPLERNMFAALRFVDTKLADYYRLRENYKINSKKDLDTVTEVLEHIGPQRVPWQEIAKAAGKPINGHTQNIIAFAREARAWMDDIRHTTNLIRKERGQKPIGFVEKYAPWIRKLNERYVLRAREESPNDYIYPTESPNPRAIDRKSAGDWARETNFDRLAQSYAYSMMKDMYYTNAVRYGNSAIKAMNNSGLRNGAKFVRQFVDEVYGGVETAATKFAKQYPRARGIALGMRRRYNRAIFGLRPAWTIAIQTGSAATTHGLFGTKSFLDGFDYVTNKKLQKWIDNNIPAMYFKQRKPGSFMEQGILADRFRRNPNAKDWLGLFSNSAERVLSGHAAATAYSYWKKRGYTGRALIFKMSEAVQKTQSRYDIAGLPGTLRSPDVKAWAPFQTFAYEMMNNLREVSKVNRVGAFNELGTNRAIILAQWLGAMYASNQLSEYVYGRNSWGLTSFIPMSNLIFAPVANFMKGHVPEWFGIWGGRAGTATAPGNLISRAVAGFVRGDNVKERVTGALDPIISTQFPAGSQIMNSGKALYEFASEGVGKTPVRSFFTGVRKYQFPVTEPQLSSTKTRKRSRKRRRSR